MYYLANLVKLSAEFLEETHIDSCSVGDISIQGGGQYAIFLGTTYSHSIRVGGGTNMS